MLWYPKMIVLYLLMMGGVEFSTVYPTDGVEFESGEVVILSDTGGEDEDKKPPPPVPVDD